MGRMSHEKGKKFEQHVARALGLVFPNVRTRRSGGETQDHAPGRDFLGTPGVCVQAKCRDRIDVWADMAKLIAAARYRDAHSDELPVLLIRRTNQGQLPGRPRPVPDLAVVPMDAMVWMLAALAMLEPEQLEALRIKTGGNLDESTRN